MDQAEDLRRRLEARQNGTTYTPPPDPAPRQRPQPLGSGPDQQVAYQVEQGKDLIQAYELPTEFARYDIVQDKNNLLKII